MRKPNFLHIFFSCVLMIIGVTALSGDTNENVHITTLMDKITFRRHVFAVGQRQGHIAVWELYGSGGVADLDASSHVRHW
ncbi:MAG: hypothetical protein R2788_21785 [Saprospiraceae bacterium]